MGMFNWVQYETVCPNCGEALLEWQTKDGQDLLLPTLQPEQVSRFYTICPKCGKWIDAEVEKPSPPSVTLTVRDSMYDTMGK